MNRTLATTALAAAIGLAIAGQGFTVQAAEKADPTKATMERLSKGNVEKCYGIAAKAKNDCAEGAHSCVGQATVDRDAKSFVLLPKGDCNKIAGGKLTAS